MELGLIALPRWEGDGCEAGFSPRVVERFHPTGDDGAGASDRKMRHTRPHVDDAWHACAVDQARDDVVSRE